MKTHLVLLVAICLLFIFAAVPVLAQLEGANVAVDIDGKHGCKRFGETIREKDFDRRGDKPQLRLMNEVYKVADLYLKLVDVLQGKNVEIHLDLNPDPHYVSYVVVQQAVGYIRGVCNVSPRVKPHAFAASCAADRYRGIVPNLSLA